MEKAFEEGLRGEVNRLGETPRLVLLEQAGGGLPLRTALEQKQVKDPAPSAERKVRLQTTEPIFFTPRGRHASLKE